MFSGDLILSYRWTQEPNILAVTANWPYNTDYFPSYAIYIREFQTTTFFLAYCWFRFFIFKKILFLEDHFKLLHSNLKFFLVFDGFVILGLIINLFADVKQKTDQYTCRPLNSVDFNKPWLNVTCACSIMAGRPGSQVTPSSGTPGGLGQTDVIIKVWR